jgi:hypothetical protein
MTVKEFIKISDLAQDMTVLQQRLESLPKPYKIGKVKTMSTLNDLSLGELMQLQVISTTREFLFVPCKVLLDMNEKQVLRADATEILGFVYWVAKEVKRINKLFASTNVPPTPEERQAGVDRLNFGFFGLVDYYAQRMGISNHEEVEYVPWIRVYKCLDMDAKRVMFERRLRNVLNKKRR